MPTTAMTRPPRSLATLPDELLLLILTLASPDGDLSLCLFRQVSRHFNDAMRRRASAAFHLRGRRVDPGAALRAGLFTGTCSVTSIRLRSTNLTADDLIDSILNVDNKVRSLTCLDMERTAVLAGKQVIAALTRSPAGLSGQPPFAALQTLTLAYFHSLELPSAALLRASLPSLDTLVLTNSCIRTSSVATFASKLGHLPRLERVFLGGVQLIDRMATNNASAPLFQSAEEASCTSGVGTTRALVIEATFLEPALAQFISGVIGDRATLATYTDLPLPKSRDACSPQSTTTTESVGVDCNDTADEKDVLERLRHWAAVSCRSPRSGITPLHANCYVNNFRAVRWLVQNGASTSAKTNDGYSPLFTAVVYNSPASARVLLNESTSEHREAMLQSRNRRLESVLYYSCLRGNANMTRVLLKHLVPRKMQHQQASESWTPLHAACIRGHVGIVKLLLRSNFEPDQANKYKQTALHIAVRTRQAEVVEVLLGAGSNVHCKDEQGHSASDVLRRLAPSTEKGNEAVKRIAKLLGEATKHLPLTPDAMPQGSHPDATPRHLHNKARRNNRQRRRGRNSNTDTKGAPAKAGVGGNQTSTDNTAGAQQTASRKAGTRRRQSGANKSRNRRGGAQKQGAKHASGSAMGGVGGATGQVARGGGGTGGTGAAL
jgi:ankyrin repeat protein